ncbi:MAG: YigZ family protein [Ruminococcaceae bacterium]|nr:YigZ family protein [Oscillospiraceae bacterium]
MQSYKTVSKCSSDEFVEKKSRFIGYVKPVQTVDEAMAFVNEIKQKHWDATHNVYAYVLRDMMTRRYSDDGEPQGTAGIPVLDVLLKAEVVDVAVVATRYFGGTLLGAGGLVRAYSHTAKIALDAGGIVTMQLCAVAEAKCDYSFYGKLPTLITEAGGKIDDTIFADDVKVVFRIADDKLASFNEMLIDVSNGKFHTEKTGEIFCAI